jgi:hypothetical protein
LKLKKGQIKSEGMHTSFHLKKKTKETMLMRTS